MTPTVIRSHSAEQWLETAAEFCASVISESVNRTGRCAILLSGGSTPRALYERLAQEPFGSNLPWAQVVVAFGDERLVPIDDERSNQRMAFDTLLDAVPLPPEHILSVDPTLPPAEAARTYEAALRRFFHLEAGEVPTFDLCLMGLGTDGHTASLFPGMATLEEAVRLVVDTPAPEADGPHRLTLTLPVFNAARVVAFLVQGAGKAGMVRRVLREGAASGLPAAFVKPTGEGARLVWLVDEAAAAELGE